VREFWSAFELDLVNYQRKCKLIRGWDDMFSKRKSTMNSSPSFHLFSLSFFYSFHSMLNTFISVAEHLNSVSAMKMSPFFKVFEEEATSWDDKLNKIRALLDVWIDVQRRWVYLEVYHCCLTSFSWF
jgi:dynein heavy chain 1, cytosolic